MVELGKIAYDGYCNATGGKSLISGAMLPKYEDLPDAIKNAWRAAAVAVLEGNDGNTA